MAMLVRESEGQTGTMFLLPLTLERLRRTLSSTDRRTAPKSGTSARSLHRPDSLGSEFLQGELDEGAWTGLG